MNAGTAGERDGSSRCRHWTLCLALPGGGETVRRIEKQVGCRFGTTAPFSGGKLRINAFKGSHSLFKFSFFPQPVRLTMSHYQPLSRPAVSSTGTTPHPVAINSSLTPTSCGQPNEVSCVGGGGSCDGVREVHGGPTCVGGGGSCDSVREVHGGPTCVGGGGSCDGVREVHGGATCAGGVGSCDGVREVHGGATLCAGGGGSCDGVREVHRGATAPDTPQRASQTNPGQYLGQDAMTTCVLKGDLST